MGIDAIIDSNQENKVFVGSTRFSIFQPTSKAWRLTSLSGGESEKELLSRLYAPERMEPRLDIFLNYSLPILSAAANSHSLKHIIHISEEMPLRYRELLQDAASQHDFLVLNMHRRGISDGAVPGAHMLAKEMVGGDGTYGIFRLDDDDLLSADYFDKAQTYIRPDFAGMRLSFATGLTGIYEGGRFSEVRQCYKPMIAIGLMNICARVGDKTVIQPPDVPHIISDRHGPVILDSREPMYFWTRHLAQDTNVGQSVSGNEFLKQELKEYPRLENELALSAKFPELANAVDLPNYAELARELFVADTPQVFEVERFSGGVELKLTVESPGENSPRGGLVSFNFVDSEGAELDLNEVDVTGLTLSPNKEIGWYRYLATVPGERVQVISISTGANTYLSSISIRRFGATSKAFTVRDLGIASV